ncbi:NAD(P)-dependent oxidoreductase [Rhizocola hellebori]|uniref:NAD(P)-dependent oxidoreductase n=1 Tax=Rhizocola hellebori TaxID=1392758 RepID=A0A8J3QGS4_9ACTN|nr:NmrA family NAD(P)-binding protein [Rhizocola hellebori]GIH10814.1 NAD(P)-dependent oxidoreductase [Rhizocola hellebori]
MRRVAVSGATKNFFKVGHTTLRTLAAQRPDIKLRLGVPDAQDAKLACDGMPVELVEWDPARPETLADVLADCQSLLMVPPIQNRVQVARSYVDTARAVGIDYICCLGVQHHDPRLTLAQEANAVKQMLADSGIAHHTLHLPVFLENLLYQVPSIATRREFAYPVDPDAKFSYVNCWDLGEVCAQVLAAPTAHPGFADTHWTATRQTTCRELAQFFSEAVGEPVTFRRQPAEDFVQGLVRKGMSEHAARGVLQLWDEVNAGNDLPPNPAFAGILGREPETAQEWITSHACCFGGPGAALCTHPKPPQHHML